MYWRPAGWAEPSSTIPRRRCTPRSCGAFRVLTPNAASIAKVSLIRLAAVTHAFDQNTRRLRLSFTADATGLTVTAPGNGNVAPPGHYMLFIVNGLDVPSVAKIVKVN
jgi:galactose oxidase